MKLQIHAIHFDADAKLIEFIQHRIGKLATYFDHVVEGDVYLRLNNEGIENKTIEIKLHVPGKQLFSKEHAQSFEVATDLATESLSHQLKKFKDKRA